MDFQQKAIQSVSVDDRIPGMAVPTFNWSPEAIADLTRYWAEGRTTREIGALLGCGKNSVISKSHRLNLPGRASPIKRDGPPRIHPGKMYRDPRHAAPARPPKPVRPAAPASSPAVAYYARMGQSSSACRWPSGEPRTPDFHFCEERAVEGKPYCADHCARAFVRVGAPRGPSG